MSVSNGLTKQLIELFDNQLSVTDQCTATTEVFFTRGGRWMGGNTILLPVLFGKWQEVLNTEEYRSLVPCISAQSIVGPALVVLFDGFQTMHSLLRARVLLYTINVFKHRHLFYHQQHILDQNVDFSESLLCYISLVSGC